MKLFTVGPVEMYPESLEIDGSQPPYFRTETFGKMMKETETLFLKSIYAPSGALFIGLTCSGTGAMESAIANVLTPKDKALVINGGSFGTRFVKLCERYHIPFEPYTLGVDDSFDKEAFSHQYANRDYTALLVNACETSTGQLYDLDFLGNFCQENKMVFIVDAVSAYLADRIDMSAQGIDVFLTASQKALALAPGVALVALSEKIYYERVRCQKNSPFYFDYNDYIKNQKRGQPPFTSAVNTMRSLHQRLASIMEKGVEAENRLHADRAKLFRSLVSELPLIIPDYPLSNACTPIRFPDSNAQEIYTRLWKKHDIWLTPSSGTLEKSQLRVGHLGNLTPKDYRILVDKLREEISL